jgi:hypothetical protein
MKPVKPLLMDLVSHRQGKQVRPIWQTGQTDFVQKLAKNSPKTQNTSRVFPHLNKRSHSATETPLLKNPSRQPTGRNRSDRLRKPVRPVLARTVGKNTARGKNSKLQEIDLPIRSTDQSETLGVDGDLVGYLCLEVCPPKPT